mmetsp:Transcript_1090/g.1978  ORF Transcript_1090/g.1978 Transcript_1090/m.1978 type:complete len:109 (+) Transcript_1090:55-381(+)
MTTPLIVGLATATAAIAARQVLLSGSRYMATPRTRKHYEGGFQPVMTRREAALILGIRESSPHDRVKAVHKKLMIANHPDSGGSDLIAAKVNEAKDILLGKKKQETIF